MRRTIFRTMLLSVLILCAVGGEGYCLSGRGKTTDAKSLKKTGTGKVAITSLKAKNKMLKRKLKILSPKGIYIVVDTAQNVLYLKKNNRVLKQAVISSGSGNILEDESGRRTWVFDTPRGIYSVKTKFRNPVWIKPDWAFIEEGEPVPEDAGERLEPNVLGDYALGFGNGYFIHGTLYTRLLGRNVTHGCIRVGDADLKAIFNAAPVGASVVIY